MGKGCRRGRAHRRSRSRSLCATTVHGCCWRGGGAEIEEMVALDVENLAPPFFAECVVDPKGWQQVRFDYFLRSRRARR